jgi:putative ABC transport system substrate-binding protein
MYRTGSPWASAVSADARSFGLTLQIVEADETNFDGALSRLVAAGTQGLVVSSDGIFFAHRQQLVDSTIRYRLPAIFAYRPQADAGGLTAYAARVDDLSRRAAFFVDRILKGAKPADLPIEQPIVNDAVLGLPGFDNYFHKLFYNNNQSSSRVTITRHQ